MLYFIKDNVLHSFPVSGRCGCIYEKEILRDTIPHDVKQCEFCINFWPGDGRR